MTYPINTSLITNHANRSYRKFTQPIKHLVLHETVSKADARQQLAYFNAHNVQANAHAFIDWNEVLLTLPFDEMGWHVGHIANAFTIGIELCRASNQEQFDKQWQIATWYFAKVCKDWGKDVGFILSHDEIRRTYGGTDHTDPIEYFAMYGKTVDDFRADVDKLLRGGYKMQQEDATKITTILSQVWTLLNVLPETEEARKEIGRLADEVRIAAGLPTKNR